MPAELFVDTSAWYPLTDAGHPDHAALSEALRTRVRSGVRIVTTNLVVAETHALLIRRVGPAPALRFVREVRAEPLLVVHSDAELELRAAEEWLARFRDQRFSLTDAVSFAVMADRGVTDALTLDRHFTVAGFTTVP